MTLELLEKSEDASMGDAESRLFYFSIWKYLLPHSAGKKALVLGAGSLECGETLGLMGAEVSNANPDELPAGEQIFDLVVVQDLSQALLGRSGQNADGKALKAFLKDLKRLLSPAGVLYLSFHRGTVLDRLLGRPRSAFGVGDIEVGLPGHQLQWVRLRDGMVGEALYRVDYLPEKMNWKDRFNLEYRTRYLGVLSRKSASPEPSLATQLIRQVYSGRTRLPALDHLGVGSGSVFRIVTPESMIRILEAENMAERCRNNYEALGRLQRLGLPFRTPAPVSQGNFQGKSYFVESMVEGKEAPYLKFDAAERARHRTAAIATLSAFHQNTRQDAVIDGALFEQHFGRPLDAFRSHLDKDTAARIQDFKEEIRRRLTGKKLPLVHLHGDYKITNLLWNEEGDLRSVIDWDLSAEKGLPLMDLLIYKGFDASVARKEHPWSEIRSAVVNSNFNADEKNYIDAFKLDPFLIRAIAVMTVAHYAQKLIVEPAKWEPLHIPSAAADLCAGPGEN